MPAPLVALRTNSSIIPTMPPGGRKPGPSSTTTTTASSRLARKSGAFDASLDVQSPGAFSTYAVPGIGAGGRGAKGAGLGGRNGVLVGGGSVITENGRRRSQRLSSGSESSDVVEVVPPPPPALHPGTKRKASPPKASTSGREADDRLAMPPPAMPASAALRRNNGLAPAMDVAVPDASFDSSNGPAGSFDFTTQPFPTPGSSKILPTSEGKRKREAGATETSAVAGRKRARVPAGGASLSEEDSTPKSLHLYGRKDWQEDTEASVILAETPMQNKNRQMRSAPAPMDLLAELGLGIPPDAARRESRRTSMDKRGGRGSSIGHGFEATPHPSIDAAEFHRHIRPTDPPPHRLRALVSWCLQRSGVPSAPASSSPSVSRILERATESVVQAVCESRVDLSWFGPVPAEGEDQMDVDGGALAKHPANENNQRKMKELDLWEQNMMYEDAARQRLLQRYHAFASSISDSAPDPAPSTGSSTSKLNFSLSDAEPFPAATVLADISQAVAYGQRILQNPVPAGWGEAGEVSAKDRRKSKGKGRASVAPGAGEEVKDGDTVDVAKVVGPAWSDVRSNTSALFAFAHELDQACNLLRAHTSHVLASAHAALSDLSRLGGPSSPTAAAASGEAGAGIAAALRGVGAATSTAMKKSGTAEKEGGVVVGVAAPGAGGGLGGGDARDLLRAIAREDTKGRK